MAKRFKVNKGKAAKAFRKSVGKTKLVNVAAPQRGGIRL